MQWIEYPSGYWVQAGWISLGAYALGCFTTGYYLVRSRTGKDLRELGSGSLGARNAGRVLGWPAFLATLLGDFLKGSLAVWAALRFTSDLGLAGIALIGVVAGHIWPIQLRLQGGKGVATLLGSLFAYDYRLAVAWVLLFSAPFAVLRRTTIPAMIAFAVLPFAAMWLARDADFHSMLTQILVTTMSSAMVLFAHRKNMLQAIFEALERRSLRTRH